MKLESLIDEVSELDDKQFSDLISSVMFRKKGSQASIQAMTTAMVEACNGSGRTFIPTLPFDRVLFDHFAMPCHVGFRFGDLGDGSRMPEMRRLIGLPKKSRQMINWSFL